MHTDIQFTEANRSLAIPRSPLLWIIIPLALGYYVFTFILTPFPLLGGLAGAFALFALLCSRSLHSPLPRLGLSFLCLSLFATGGFNLLLHDNPVPEIWNTLPPREVDLILQLNEVTSATAENPYAYGLGTILSAPTHSPELQSQQLSFILDNTAIPAPAISAAYRVRGVIHPPSDTPNPYNPPNVHFNLKQGYFINEVQPPNPYHQHLNHLTAFCTQALSQNHPTDLGAKILTAMVLGQRNQLPSQNKAAFIRSGTMHRNNTDIGYTLHKDIGYTSVGY